ncbi:GAF domain-containing protein [Maribacter confluentis]|uniref:GAF domain-containing protein n=1 Tax=Maribacter confluentis TaxID=1656093 RepID=A0ABT8RM49_9FLAO|nr:GAF domain-containing protein [Maribacter confluentis]MDO1511394.1 GAF domain-containing protein [Maribacter confluentis]
MSITSEIPKTITDELGNDHPNWALVLNATLNFFDCTTGTIHTLDQNSLLQLTAHKGIPEFLIPKLTTIPIGKGMAGIAAERKKPVEMCNLQTDDSGVARPSAKDTKVEGSLAAPLLHDNTLYGTIGIAKPIPYDFSEKEISLLMQIGNLISKKMIK